MANAVTAAGSNTGTTEASQIDEDNAVVPETGENITGELDTTALESELNKAADDGNLTAVIKSFVAVVSSLISSLSKIMEKLTGATSKTTKKAKEATKKLKAAGKKKSKTKNSKTKTGASVATTKETSKTTTTPSPATATETSAAATTPAVVSQDPIVSTTKPEVKSEIDPELGYADDYLSVSTNKQGAPEIYTEDGYILRFEGKDQAWNIITPDGKANRIWGDPHVVESDGETWDFKERSTFLFGNNKATVETVPYGNGQTLTSKVSIYNGDTRVSINGVATNKPVFEAIARDAELDDALRDDGDIFVLGKEGNGEDRFVLLKDVGEKFDEKFAQQVGVDEAGLAAKYLTDEQMAFLKD